MESHIPDVQSCVCPALRILVPQTTAYECRSDLNTDLMHLTQKPANAEFLTVDNGVKSFRMLLDDNQIINLEMSSTELLWLITMKGNESLSLPGEEVERNMVQGNSSVFFYARGPWQVQIKSSGKAQTLGFGITLTALHDLLAVEFDASKSAENSKMDYSRLTQIISLTPRHLQDIDNVFLQSDESRFGTIARRGAFLSSFATLLETFYGKQLSQCPFHIDFETEQKIRKAHEILVADLQDMRDIPSLARETNLPRTVLKEGFEYLYGKPTSQYFQDYKFEKSLEMLETGKYLIRDIAFAVGFQNPSHFISAFKQRYKTTPKQWIKKRHLKVAPDQHTSESS
jgi:AraC-like DNA-binding protein